MKFTALIAVALLFDVSAASPSLLQDHVLHEKRDAVPNYWVKRSRIERRAQLPMRIGLTQSNLDRVEDLLMEISPKYGKYYTSDEVIELFAPAKEAVEATIAWLTSAGISHERISLSANKQWIQFDSPAEEMESLLKTEYHSWEHIPTGKKHVACDEYHLPKHIQRHVDYVSPGLKLLVTGKVSTGNTKAKRSPHPKRPGHIAPVKGPVVRIKQDMTKQETLDQCDTQVTPNCIFAMYNITMPTKSDPSNKLGIFEEGDYYIPQDLTDFFNQFAPNVDPSAAQPQLKGIDGGFAPQQDTPGEESDLDFEISIPLIYPQGTVLYQTDDPFYASGLEGGGGFLNTFLDAIDGSYCMSSRFGETGDADIDPHYPNPNLAGYQGQRQCDVYQPTNVISISYGQPEAELPGNYQRRQCAEFLKLGLRGTSVVVSAGDGGVAARYSIDGNTNGCLGDGTVFAPSFPASCRFVTTLGATYLPEGSDVNKDQEVATTRFPTGGGFSNVFVRPKYQRSKVMKFFRKYAPNYLFYKILFKPNPPASVTNGGIYNHRGRGFPDASAVGDNVVIVNNGQTVLTGGTSASAPVFAAILTRINEERIAVGKSTVGFVNPTLYKNPQMFNDITTGTNPGCGTDGFPASPGWDPVTGLGMGDLVFINDAGIVSSAPYSISKGAVNTAVAKFNAAYKKHGILFLAISPGLVDTGKIPAENNDDGPRFMAYAGPDFKGPMTPEESAHAVLKVIDEASLEKGDGGAFLSHFGNKRWL